MAESGAGCVVVVLRTDGKEHASLTERQAVLLKRCVCFADRGLATNFNLLDAIVANYAAPQSVVEVEDEGFAALTIERLNQGTEGAGEFEVGLRRKQEFVAEVAIPVEPLLESESG